ncbi:hypothetical protein PG984_001884 [Apiospora sp. TS-2023a]
MYLQSTLSTKNTPGPSLRTAQTAQGGPERPEPRSLEGPIACYAAQLCPTTALLVRGNHRTVGRAAAVCIHSALHKAYRTVYAMPLRAPGWEPRAGEARERTAMEAGLSRVGLVGCQLVTIPIWPSCHLTNRTPSPPH